MVFGSFFQKTTACSLYDVQRKQAVLFLKKEPKNFCPFGL
jgi:hypothetical protein